MLYNVEYKTTDDGEWFIWSGNHTLTEARRATKELRAEKKKWTVRYTRVAS